MGGDDFIIIGMPWILVSSETGSSYRADQVQRIRIGDHSAVPIFTELLHAERVAPQHGHMTPVRIAAAPYGAKLFEELEARGVTHVVVDLGLQPTHNIPRPIRHLIDAFHNWRPD